MEILKNAVSWVEIPVDDFQRAKKFYSEIFDFQMPEMQMGPALMGFFLMDQQGGGVGGAIVKSESHVPSKQGSKVYLNGGSDLNVVLNRIEAAGGKTVLPKTEITPEIGYFAIFEDTEGNEVCLHSLH
jgi:predicted enzyme related to lactoylglutathione lyase